MTCHFWRHFIWVFTVCQSIHLGVSSIQKVKGLMPFVYFDIIITVPEVTANCGLAENIKVL